MGSKHKHSDNTETTHHAPKKHKHASTDPVVTGTECLLAFHDRGFDLKMEGWWTSP